MSHKQEQNYKNHGKIDPTFHFILFTILLVNLIATTVHLAKSPSVLAIWIVVLSVAAILGVFKIRLYAMTVQDRVIRLEERLRLQALAPEEWHGQLFKLSLDQLIALRFASDDEVVGLAKESLELGLDRKKIKQRIKSWRADHLRV